MRYLTLITVLLLIAGCNPFAVNDERVVTYRVELVEGYAYRWMFFDPGVGMTAVTNGALPWEATVMFHAGVGDNASVGVWPRDDASTMSVQIICDGEVVVEGETTGNDVTVWYWTVE